MVWGLNVYGQLGLGDTKARYKPERISVHVPGFQVVKVAAGSNFSAAITESGELWTWGCGCDGRLGHKR